MPTYEYECKKCGHQFETHQSISELPLTQCPECQGAVHRLVSGGAGFLMKGGSSSYGTKGKGCSLEETGRTCCGATQRCGKPACGE